MARQEREQAEFDRLEAEMRLVRARTEQLLERNRPSLTAKSPPVLDRLTHGDSGPIAHLRTTVPSESVFRFLAHDSVVETQLPVIQLLLSCADMIDNDRLNITNVPLGYTDYRGREHNVGLPADFYRQDLSRMTKLLGTLLQLDYDIGSSVFGSQLHGDVIKKHLEAHDKMVQQEANGLYQAWDDGLIRRTRRERNDFIDVVAKKNPRPTPKDALLQFAHGSAAKPEQLRRLVENMIFGYLGLDYDPGREPGKPVELKSTDPESPFVCRVYPAENQRFRVEMVQDLPNVSTVNFLGSDFGKVHVHSNADTKNVEITAHLINCSISELLTFLSEFRSHPDHVAATKSHSVRRRVANVAPDGQFSSVSIAIPYEPGGSESIGINFFGTTGPITISDVGNCQILIGQHGGDIKIENCDGGVMIDTSSIPALTIFTTGADGNGATVRNSEVGILTCNGADIDFAGRLTRSKTIPNLWNS
ncbi:hypothetical protein A2690_04720 [Candidatus Roizmanbacteria bacterium RIFCSPHIGHO2_01_FULL_39_12b]|uniref:Uncharacterized protein n=1 Tax=Candidatus Roizmanbacteria bacterium RIFCSPHIGHO2_01_FULL_39_12b TaxID=1802030 RepID=A0A1F7GA75_9BACT|nr:MAG: hypothetical protein A2690_04720 [Candidatus Roizmanbacteria bacterium RIFCSPHIGHO2_01_FULL_39_12b]OGK46754.1 MAG: hypothetical protein A3B46_02345 [Candidatus Roizmanbacteria bacterium RIFCSPLOWO2_01_FULL_39_19]